MLRNWFFSKYEYRYFFLLIFFTNTRKHPSCTMVRGRFFHSQQQGDWQKTPSYLQVWQVNVGLTSWPNRKLGGMSRPVTNQGAQFLNIILASIVDRSSVKMEHYIVIYCTSLFCFGLKISSWQTGDISGLGNTSTHRAPTGHVFNF